MSARTSKRPRSRSWLALASSLLGLATLVMAVHRLSPLLPGSAGAVFRQNVDQSIDASALVYTESGDVRDYLDEDRGKYR